MFSPRKILVIKLRALGDTVLITAPLLELRRAYPDAEIHVLVTDTWASLLECHPAINHIWSYTRHKETAARAKALARIAFQLRKEKFDCVINLHASPSSSAIAYATGAKVRSIHFHGHKDKNRYSTVTVPGKGILKPVIERDMDTIRALDVTVPVGVLPQIFLREEEKRDAAKRLEGIGIHGPLLCIGIGASRTTKVWPLDRFATIAIRWCDEFQGSVLCFNSVTEDALAREFFAAVNAKLDSWYSDSHTRRAVRSRIFLQTQVPLRQMAGFMQSNMASLYLGNDSGPKHIAVASGLPTITLFGPEDPFEWHPYPRDRNAVHFIEGLACRNDQDPGMRPWCGLHTCTVEEHRCMRLLSEDDVFRTVQSLARTHVQKLVSPTAPHA